MVRYQNLTRKPELFRGPLSPGPGAMYPLNPPLAGPSHGPIYGGIGGRMGPGLPYPLEAILEFCSTKHVAVRIHLYVKIDHWFAMFEANCGVLRIFRDKMHFKLPKLDGFFQLMLLLYLANLRVHLLTSYYVVKDTSAIEDATQF